MTGFQPERCAECTHPIGDHSIVKTGGLRPPAVGGCLLTACDCTTYRKDSSDAQAPHEPDLPRLDRTDDGGGDHRDPPVVLGHPHPHLSGDQFVDAVYDGRSERAGDGVGLTQPEAVAASLGAPHGSDLYPYMRDRHPFGWTALDRAPLTGTPPTLPGGTPTGLRPVSPPIAGTQAGGDHLPDLAA